jgi:hypothetical protein
VRELQIVQLSATRYSCFAILWASLVSFAAIILCVASQQLFIIVVDFLMTQSGNFWLHPRIGNNWPACQNCESERDELIPHTGVIGRHACCIHLNHKTRCGLPACLVFRFQISDISWWYRGQSSFRGHGSCQLWFIPVAVCQNRTKVVLSIDA